MESNAQGLAPGSDSDSDSQLKTREEVTVTIDAVVEFLTCERRDVDPSRIADLMRARGRDHNVTVKGEYYTTTMSVKTGTPVQVITCKGMVPMMSGDNIRASIVRGELYSIFRAYADDGAYVPREFHETEEAVKLEKLVDGKVVAEYIPN